VCIAKIAKSAKIAKIKNDVASLLLKAQSQKRRPLLLIAAPAFMLPTNLAVLARLAILARIDR
jgi:hypothetical protein